MPLIPDLAKRLPDCRLHGKGDERRLVFQVDGVWLDARARSSPVIEIYVRTADVPDLTMRIRPRDRRWTTDAGFLDLLEIDASDETLVNLWLDPPAQQALVGALWLPEPPDADLVAPWSRHDEPAGCDFFYERGEVLVRHENDLAIDRLERAVLAGATIAARPHRIGAEWLAIARGLGGTTTADRWGVDGEFAATIERGPATVRIENRIDRGLVTRVSARRIAATDDRWVLAKDEVPRRRRPKVDADEEVVHGPWRGVAIDPARLLGRLRPLGHLLDAAGPDVLWNAGDEVALSWGGMVSDAAWLGPAVELIARLAVDIDAAQGPYR